MNGPSGRWCSASGPTTGPVLPEASVRFLPREDVPRPRPRRSRRGRWSSRRGGSPTSQRSSAIRCSPTPSAWWSPCARRSWPRSWSPSHPASAAPTWRAPSCAACSGSSSTVRAGRADAAVRDVMARHYPFHLVAVEAVENGDRGLASTWECLMGSDRTGRGVESGWGVLHLFYAVDRERAAADPGAAKHVRRRHRRVHRRRAPGADLHRARPQGRPRDHGARPDLARLQQLPPGKSGSTIRLGRSGSRTKACRISFRKRARIIHPPRQMWAISP